MAVTKSLEERAKQLRAEIDAIIDTKAEQIAKDCPGIPIGVIRSSLTRHSGCQCAVYAEMSKKDARDGLA